MAIIKTVTNGNGSAEFRAISFGHAVTVAFGLMSIIGAQQTWLWASAHERNLIASQLSELSEDRSVNALRIATLDAEVRALRARMDVAERQININTGKLDQGAAWRNR